MPPCPLPLCHVTQAHRNPATTTRLRCRTGFTRPGRTQLQTPEPVNSRPESALNEARRLHIQPQSGLQNRPHFVQTRVSCIRHVSGGTQHACARRPKPRTNSARGCQPSQQRPIVARMRPTVASMGPTGAAHEPTIVNANGHPPQARTASKPNRRKPAPLRNGSHEEARDQRPQALTACPCPCPCPCPCSYHAPFGTPRRVHPF